MSDKRTSHSIGFSEASLSGREHAVSGFFDQPKLHLAEIGAKRQREETPPSSEDERDNEEREEDEKQDIDKMLEEAEPVEVMDLHQLRRAVIGLERKINRNQALRVKHSDDASKFMESEIELFEEINKLQAVATAPELYVEFVKLNGVTRVSELLDHENVDIAIAAVDLIHELTDPEALMEAEEEEGAKALVDALVDNAAIELLVKNLARLDESTADGQQGVYNTLAIFENLSELRPEVLETACERTDLMPWILRRLAAKPIDQNKVYCSEVLSILCQAGPKNRARVGQNGGMDALLQLVAPWKRRDPGGAEEAEIAHNVFGVVCAALMAPANQAALVEGEGVELMVIMMQFRKFAARSALKVLHFAMLRNTAACERFVSAMGLKTLFPGFLRPASVCLSRSKEGRGAASEDEEHSVSIVASLLLRLGGEAHARVMHKFVENNYEKVDRLMELHDKYYSRLAAAQRKEEVDRAAGKAPEDEDDGDDLSPEEKRYMRRLDMGLYTLQQVDVIIAYLLTEGVPGIEKRIKQLLHQSDAGLHQVREVLAEYRDNIGDAAAAEGAGGDGLNMKEVAGDLLAFLDDLIAADAHRS